MTQTSDECPNSSSAGGGGNISSNSSKTTPIEIVDHDKKEKEKGNSAPISIKSGDTLHEEQDIAVVVPKVSQAEESTQISSVAEKGNSDAPGIFSSANNTTIANVISFTPVTNIVIPTTGTTSNNNIDGVITSSSSTEMNVLDDVNSTSHTFSKAPMCAVCSEPCICYCKSCKKASYCSKEHQRKHWKQHRPECFPVTIQVNSVFGSHLVVTRDIKRGEVILCERPLLITPFLNHTAVHNTNNIRSSNEEDKKKDNMSLPTKYYSVCLSCHKIMWEEDSNNSTSSQSSPYSSSKTTCSRCGWPICCPECEKHPIHADQECKIFAEYHVEPSALCDMDAQFLCVALLRILQHKKELDSTSSSAEGASGASNSKWSRFMDVVNKQMPMKEGLNSQLAEAKKATARFADLIRKSLGSIIYNEYSVTDAEIDQIVRALKTNSFITDNDGNYMNGFSGSANKNGHFFCKNILRYSNSGKFLTVYHLASMLTSNCVPNASWVIQQPSLDFYLRASTPIKTGERITITFVDPLLGTRERRELLWKEKYLSCSCSRCADPTESCTFFSAIKCPGKKVGNEQAMAAATINGSSDGGVICECEGYILPTDPLAVTYTSWHSSSFGCCCSDAQVADQETVRSHREEDSLPGEKLCEDRMAEWKCNVCLMRQPWGFVQNSLERMRRILLLELLGQANVCFTMNIEQGGSSGGGGANANKVVPEESKHGENTRNSGNPPCNDLEILEARVDKIDSLVGNVAHANHYYILKMENEILSSISELLEKGQVPFEEMEKWAVRMIELCKKGLKVVNVLCPGLSTERGRLLYFLQQGLTISLLFKTSRAMRIIINPTEDSTSSNKSVNINSGKEVLSHEELMKKFYEILLARKEVLEVFAMTKDNSREKEMLKAVQHDTIEVRLLKNYFKSHQNISVQTKVSTVNGNAHESWV